MTSSDMLRAFRDLFPEFSMSTDNAVRQSLATANTMWRGSAMGQTYLAAHLMALSIRSVHDNEMGASENGGEITGVQIGDHRLNFLPQAVNKKNESGSRDTFFTRTEYGRTFLEIQKRSALYTFGARLV